MPDILVVDDDPVAALVASRLLTRHYPLPGQVLSSADVAQTRRIAASQSIKVLVVDYQLPDGDGVALFRAVRNQHPFVRGILVSAHLDMAIALQVVEAGFDDCIAKPVTEDDRLEATVKESMRRYATWRYRIAQFNTSRQQEPGDAHG